MPLTRSTDLENISTAEAVLNWVAIGAQTPAIEPDFFVQGSNCISRAVSGASTEKGMWYDLVTGGHAALNFNAGGAYENTLIYIWMKCQTRGLIDTMANGGMKIRIGSSLTAWSEFNVAGSDYGVPDNEGWIPFVIDPTLTATATSGGGANLGAISHIGGTIKTTTTAKGQNFGIDRISVGRGEIRAYGTSTVGKGFKDLADWDWSDNTTQRWGLMTVKGGIIFCKCKIVLGDASGTNSTDFTSTDECLVWEAPMYYQGGTRQKAVPDEDEDGLGYWGVTLQGNATGTNSFKLGTMVGTDKGRSGDTLIAATNSFLSTPARPGCRFLATDTDIDVFEMCGCVLRNFERTSPANAVDLAGVPASEHCYSNTFDGCGRLYFGAVDVRNCTILNSYTDTDDGAVKWDSVTDLADCLLVNNTHSIVFEATTGTPFTFTNISFGTPALGVRNESGGAITISIVGGNEPTAENTGGSTTAFIVNAVTLTLTVKDMQTLAVVAGARVLALADAGGWMPANATVTITRLGSTATVAHNAHGLATNDYVRIKGANEVEYNGVVQITVTGVHEYTYQVSGTPNSPATGTIKSSGVLISALTNASGVVSDTRSHSVDQPFTGVVRMGTGAGKVYKDAPLSGTVYSSTGLAATVQLIPD